LPPSWWVQIKEQGLASVFYVENWLLANNAVDYLASENDESPFQHFWSLGVEEQFYLLWPLLVALGALIAARRVRAVAKRSAQDADTPASAPPVRPVLALIFIPVTLASFYWSVHEVASGNPTAYFSTLTRLWELALGAVLALVPASVRLPGVVRGLATWAGLAAIGAGCLFITPTMPFPGVAALPATVGAALVIGGGPIPPRWGLKRVSELAPVQWIGNISYSLYLWHFPPIVIFTILTERSPGRIWGPVLALGAICLAAFSYYVVENPIRHSAGLRARSGLSLGLAGVAMAVAGGIALAPGVAIDRYESRWLGNGVHTGLKLEFGAPAMELGLPDPAFLDPNLGLVPSVLEPMEIGSVPDHGPKACRSEQFADEVVRCEWAPPGGGRFTVAMVGDSNMRQYLPAMVELAPAMRIRLITYLKQGCPFNSEGVAAHEERKGPCLATNERTMRGILEDAPDLVLTAQRADKPFVDSHTGEVPGVMGFVDMWSRLHDAGIPVAVIRPTARIEGVMECVTEHMADPNACAAPASEQMATREQQIVARALELAPFAKDIDLRDYLCDDRRCYAAIGNVVVYRDATHITTAFSQSLAAPLRDELAEALRP
ncbi:MAG: acyltransferase, partial [Bifidobacteriaceae bacterium]|nr:acyltransferase [Bifidobacteriaceae bacterium]